MKYFIFLSLILIGPGLHSQVDQTEYKLLPPITSKIESSINGQPCQQKYSPPAEYEIQTNRYAVYIGDESTEDVDIKIKIILTSAPKSIWEERSIKDRHTEKNKLRACLVEVPAITEEITILADTTQSKNFVIMEFDEEVLVREEGSIEWVESICSQNVTEEFVEILQNKLGLEGYYKGPITKKVDIGTKNALIDYQRDNDLRVGILDTDTARALGVIF